MSNGIPGVPFIPVDFLWEATQGIWGRLEHFKKKEFKHPEMMKDSTLLKLDRTRELAGVPMFISSDGRPGDRRSHGRGHAVDVTDDLDHNGVTGTWVWKVVFAAKEAGFRRIGVYNGHVHMDDDPDSPQEVMWGGESE